MINIEKYKVPKEISDQLLALCNHLEADVIKKTGIDEETACLLVACYLNRFAENISMLAQMDEDGPKQ